MRPGLPRPLPARRASLRSAHNERVISAGPLSERARLRRTTTMTTASVDPRAQTVAADDRPKIIIIAVRESQLQGRRRLAGMASRRTARRRGAPMHPSDECESRLSRAASLLHTRRACARALSLRTSRGASRSPMQFQRDRRERRRTQPALKPETLFPLSPIPFPSLPPFREGWGRRGAARDDRATVNYARSDNDDSIPRSASPAITA